MIYLYGTPNPWNNGLGNVNGNNVPTNVNNNWGWRPALQVHTTLYEISKERSAHVHDAHNRFLLRALLK